MIYINGKFLEFQKATGVQRYALEICKRLPKSLNGKDICLAVSKTTFVPKELQHLKLVEFGNFKGNLWEQIDLPFHLKKKGNPPLININGIGPVLYKNTFLFIHDLSFKHHPEWFSKSFSKSYNLLIPINAKNAKKIFTVSNYSKEDIINSYKIDAKKIEVIYAAVSNEFKIKNSEKENIILMVSSLDPRKNMKRTIEAFSKIETDYTLIIIGNQATIYSDTELEKFKKNNRISFTGYVSNRELVNWYNKAKVFIYPSLLEGFGIPPLEAQACGCPVIVSDRTSLPEIFGNSVLYCNPEDVDSIKNSIEELLYSDKKREELINKGIENEKKYDWDNSVAKFLEKLNEAL